MKTFKQFCEADIYDYKIELLKRGMSDMPQRSPQLASLHAKKTAIEDDIKDQEAAEMLKRASKNRLITHKKKTSKKGAEDEDQRTANL